MLEYESQLLRRDIAELKEYLADGSQADITFSLEMMEDDADTVEEQIPYDLLDDHPDADDLEDEVNELEQLVAHLRHLIAVAREAEEDREATPVPKTASKTVSQAATSATVPDGSPSALSATVPDGSPSGPSVLTEEPAAEAPAADLDLDDPADPDLHDDLYLEPPLSTGRDILYDAPPHFNPFHDYPKTEEELARIKAHKRQQRRANLIFIFIIGPIFIGLVLLIVYGLQCLWDYLFVPDISIPDIPIPVIE